jgi:hypothetical protein
MPCRTDTERIYVFQVIKKKIEDSHKRYFKPIRNFSDDWAFREETEEALSDGVRKGRNKGAECYHLSKVWYLVRATTLIDVNGTLPLLLGAEMLMSS